MRLFDKLFTSLLIVTVGSWFWDRDFFFGMLLFLINFISFKIIIKTLFSVPEDNSSFAKKFIFVPSILIKMLAIGFISYYVLVVLNGSPYFFIAGFAAGLIIFTAGLLMENFFSKDAESSSE